MLTFRLFGKFNWPFDYTPPAASPINDPVAGVVEIHFMPVNGATGALLRWSPGRTVPADLPADLPGTVPNAFDPAQVIPFRRDAEQLVWIHSATATGRKLAFRGAFWLEQFVPASGASQLDIAWPLVRSCLSIGAEL